MKKLTKTRGMIRLPALACTLLIPAFAAGAALPMAGSDIAAGANWGACIDVQRTESSAVFEFLSQVIAHERLDHLMERARKEWSIDLDALETISVYGANDNWMDITLVARGDFSAVDFYSAPQPEPIVRHNTYAIHRYAPVDHLSLLFAKVSDRVLVGADTLDGIKRALDVLDGVHTSHAEVADQPRRIRDRLASADCVMGLNVEALKEELNLESRLLRGTHQAWFALREDGYQVEADVLMDHGSAASAAGALSELKDVILRAFETNTTPAVVVEFLDALSSQTEGQWVAARAAGSSYDMVDMLAGLQDLLYAP